MSSSTSLPAKSMKKTAALCTAWLGPKLEWGPCRNSGCLLSGTLLCLRPKGWCTTARKKGLRETYLKLLFYITATLKSTRIWTRGQLGGIGTLSPQKFETFTFTSIWIRAHDAYFIGEIILCEILVSDSLLENVSFRQTVTFILRTKFSTFSIFGRLRIFALSKKIFASAALR